VSTNFPGMDGLLRSEILEALRNAGRSGLDRKSIDRLAAPRFSPDDVSRSLSDLESGGDAVLWNDRWLALSSTDWVVGQVHRLDRGDAVLRSGRDAESGYFIFRSSLKGASDGDLVLARRASRSRRLRRANRLPEAVVLKVLRRRVQHLVGLVERRHGQFRLLPFDPRVSIEVRLVGVEEEMVSQYVVCDVEATGSPRPGAATAIVQEVLGEQAAPGVDLLATLRHFGIPDAFPRETLDAAATLPADPAESDLEGREDLRGAVLVTIDGESARDFDDAISVEETGDGGFRLGVHIADVSHYVDEGGVLDQEAYRRGTSVYFPDRAVPMLPEHLSNGLCSLRPDVPRLTISAFLDFSANGEVLGSRFARTVIESRRRLTYDEVRRLLEEPRSGDEGEYGEVLPVLKCAERLMRILLAERLARGSIDFDLPEGDVILDLEGAAVGVRPGERSVAHRIIEEFMIAANEAVARELVGSEQPALFRVHDEPDREHLHELRGLLEPLGIELDVSPEVLHPSALQAVLRQVEDSPSEALVASLVLRSMARARYEPESRGHYALGSRHYTHFTSPIRRYPDLLVHRQLKRLLDESQTPTAQLEELEGRLPTIAEHTSAMEARAEQAERLVLQWKVVRMLAGREGELFSARVTGVKPYGMFLQLTNLYVDGLLPLAHMRDDFYEYRAERHELVGRKGRTFRLGDELEVVLRDVDVTRRRLLFDLPQGEQARSGRISS
jgi:ribonuclease R